MDRSQQFVGIALSKTRLDLAIYPQDAGASVAHDAPGILGMVTRLQILQPTLIVLEATGGFERGVVGALAAAPLPVVVVNPRQVRDFAKATGHLAKTDTLEAQVLARCAEAIRPALRPVPDAAQEEMRALVARRRQLIEMVTAENNRLARAIAPVRLRLQRPITWLTTELMRVDADLEKSIQRSPIGQAQNELLQRVPGVGPVMSRTGRAELPELGPLTQKQMAALVGGAPLNHESGTLRGRRHVWGGRAPVRAALYLAALVATRWNPAIRRFYHHLRDIGKAPKVALVACMRKLLIMLNAMLKHQTPWRAESVLAS